MCDQTKFQGCDVMVLAAVIARLSLGCVFVLAGLLKWKNKPNFSGLLKTLGIDSDFWSRAAQYMLPMIEILLGLWLLSGKNSYAALIITICFLAGFTALLWGLVRRGYSEGCACFGSSDDRPIGFVHYMRNGVLLLAAVFAKFQRGDAINSGLSFELVLMTLIIVAVSSMVYRGLLEIQDLHRATRGRSL